MLATSYRQRKLSVSRLAWLLLCLLIFPRAANAQLDDGASVPDQLKVGQKLSSLEAELRDVKTSVDRLEAKLDRLLAVPSDFSRVLIRMKSEDGKPLAGYHARFVSQAKEGRYISISGTSDKEGLAVERTIPYGKYDLFLKEPTGWSTYIKDVVVEIGKELELDVVAPDPSLRGELVLVSQLKETAFSNLPFGEVQKQAGGGYSVGYGPEPTNLEQRWRTYPTAANGLSAAGARVTISAMQELRQSDGKMATWRWSRNDTGDRGNRVLVLTPGNVWLVHGLESKSARPNDSPFFAKLESDERIGFLVASKVEQPGNSHVIDVPIKDVEIVVSAVVGKASPEVCQWLGEAKADSVWLNANLRPESQWLDKLFTMRDWETADTPNALMKKTLELPPGERVEVVLASP